METNKEQHTPEPWIFDEVKGKIFSQKRELLFIPSYTVTREIQNANTHRVAACVNAMEGIEDPEFYIKESQNALKASLKINAELQTYKTACEGINPDNPMAVAENLTETFSLIKKKAQIISYELSGEPSEENASCAKVLADEIEELLTKIQAKSLHDQIRDGGWDFVIKTAGDKYKMIILNAPLVINADDNIYQKVCCYTMLVALSKVLNEGKKTPHKFIVKPQWEEDRNRYKLIVDSAGNRLYPIDFCRVLDADFALEFAEKEFKLFYNHK